MTEDLTQYQTVITIPEKAVPFFEKALDPYAKAPITHIVFCFMASRTIVCSLLLR